MSIETVKIAGRDCCPKCERETPHPEIVISHICPPPPASDLSDARTFTPTILEPKRHKVVYIAGPMRGYAEFNFPAFDEARNRGILLGFQIVSPADMDRERHFFATGAKGEDGELANFDMDAAIHADIEAILAADAIAMLPGWEKSTGAMAEYRIALWAKKEVLDARTFKSFENWPHDTTPTEREYQEHMAGFAEPLFQSGDHKAGDFVLKDTGNREVFATGAQRDSGGGIKGWFHALPYIALERWAKWTQAGGQKYGKFNMRKGLPLSSYLDSAGRHLGKLCNHETDEDHAAAVLWNVGEFIHTLEEIKAGRLPRELYDIGFPSEGDKIIL